MAQRLFDNCVQRLDGPDAPDVVWTPSDQKIGVELVNERISSNNYLESYSEIGGPITDAGFPYDEQRHEFEGYVVYQLRDTNVTRAEYDDPEKARMVFQTDRENEAVDLYNWNYEENPTASTFENPLLLVPELKVQGANQGIQNSFEITTDLFNREPLVNYETYYYTAIAYAFNEYAPFDPETERGQISPYIEGKRNVQIYQVIPRDLSLIHI